MRPSPDPLVEPVFDDALEIDGPGLSGRIADFRGGILSGSIEAAGMEAPGRLIVTANGRRIGDAAILWKSPPADRPAACRGVWFFDAKDLPPALLLEDRICFAITSPGSGSLDAIDVAPSQFPSRLDLPRGRGPLEGYIDGTENGVVRGWVWDPTNAGQRIKLQLFLGSRFCGTYVANHRRPDLEASGRGDGHYGFAIPAQIFMTQIFMTQAASGEPCVQLVSGEPYFWDVPPAPHLKARKGRFSLPRRRADPDTTRDLVDLLASADPFPKKIYVIDRLTRTMPEAFSAEYVLLALEYLRIEMLKAPSTPATLWARLASWWRQRVIRSRIRRLAALADAIAASQTILDGARTPETPPKTPS